MTTTRIYSVPDHTLGGLKRYVEHRIPPGSFLHAVLSNDLVGAFARADDLNQRAMREIVSYVYSELPANAWGSPEKVEAWLRGEEGAA